MGSTTAGRPAARILISFLVMAGLSSAGCAPKKPPEDPKPQMSAGEGAVAGKLVTSSGDAFDPAMAGKEKGKLEIELVSPASGVVATVSPIPGKAEFIFDHVKPGTYELSVFRAVPGKMTIAGSEPVTVNAGEVASAAVRVQVTPNEGDTKD